MARRSAVVQSFSPAHGGVLDQQVRALVSTTVWDSGGVEERTQSAWGNGERSRHLHRGEKSGREAARIVAGEGAGPRAATATTTAAASAARVGGKRGDGGCCELGVMNQAMGVDARRDLQQSRWNGCYAEEPD